MKAAMMVPGRDGGRWEIREVQRPTVPPGQVLVRVRASSINRAELRSMRRFIADLMPVLANGRIRPIIDRCFPLDALPTAQAYVEADRHVGKIVIQI